MFTLFHIFQWIKVLTWPLHPWTIYIISEAGRPPVCRLLLFFERVGTGRVGTGMV